MEVELLKKMHARAKHISKSECYKNCGFRALLSVEMFQKNEHRSGAKHVSKSKCAKHTILGALLEVELLKSALRCGAKCVSVQESFCVTGAMDSAPCPKQAEREGL